MHQERDCPPQTTVHLNGNYAPHGKFWQFNLGHLLIMIGLAGSFIVFLNRYENRFSTDESNINTNGSNIAKLSILVERMDTNGTNASQRGILKETEAISSNTHRIENLEKTLSEVAPKVERTNTNLEWLMNYIRDGEDGKGGIYKRKP